VSWTEFIASLVDSLAWPAGAVIVAALFRRHIAGLLEGEVKRLKAGPVEVEYWQIEAARVAERVVAAGTSFTAEAGEETQRLLGLADEEPHAVVLESFAWLERELQTRVKAAGLTGERKAIVPLAVEAAEARVITPESAEAIRALSVLRNLVAHGPPAEVTGAKAREFLALAQAVAYSLRAGPKPDAES